MTKDEALKLALEALNALNPYPASKEEQRSAAITAIKEALAQPENCEYCDGTGDVHSIDGEWRGVCICEAGKALAQPEQEPVATDWERIARVQNAKLMAVCDEAGGFEKLCEVMDKYERTTPPQRTWVGLTDEEIQYCVELKNLEAIAEEVEAKLKEKNT